MNHLSSSSSVSKLIKLHSLSVLSIRLPFSQFFHRKEPWNWLHYPPDNQKINKKVLFNFVWPKTCISIPFDDISIRWIGVFTKIKWSVMCLIVRSLIGWERFSGLSYILKVEHDCYRSSIFDYFCLCYWDKDCSMNNSIENRQVRELPWFRLQVELPVWIYKTNSQI